MKNILKAVGFILIIIIAIIAGGFLDIDEKLGFKEKLQSREVHSGEYALINPLLFCDIGADTFKVSGFNPLRLKLVEFIDQEAEKGTIVNASIYVRDLKSGTGFGIDEHRRFSPASLLKLPVLITYYKKSESNKALLSQKIEYAEDIEVPDEEFSESSGLEKGKSYTIRDLLERMISTSDNVATVLLLSKINDMSVKNTMREIGIELDTSDPNQDVMTVLGYGTLYRVLYNASFLSKTNSSKVIKILTKANFPQGIAAGVPKGTIVAHKYGERRLADINQLHDCGIVYYDQNPYSLCIMTRGVDYSKLTSFIARASKLVYDGVRQKYN